MNRKCRGYGRVIYTGATRCVFCKWDLSRAQRRIEVRAEVGHLKRTGGEGGILLPPFLASADESYCFYSLSHSLDFRLKRYQWYQSPDSSLKALSQVYSTRRSLLL
jgi:hypothetical protein